MSLIKLQEKIGATPDGSFGPNTMKKAMAFFKLTPERAAHFFGQTAHETGGFNAFSENLNYSANGLLGTFKKYFTPAQAEKYARQPEKIASRVYANRMGNGDEASKQGWIFRGRGALQTTGKDNYTQFATHLCKPEILLNPDLVATEYSFQSALFFFEKNKLWTICDKGVNDATILALTKKINGGTHGLDDRMSLTKRYYSWVSTPDKNITPKAATTKK
jgi:putative chitinase